jgi:hypothetical protein
MSINIVISFVFNDPLETIGSIEEDALDVDENQVFPYLCHGSENIFKNIKLTVLLFLLHHPKEPEVTQTQIWRIRWTGKAFKPRVSDFCHNAPSIVTLGIVHVKKKLCLSIFVAIWHLLTNNVG